MLLAPQSKTMQFCDSAVPFSAVGHFRAHIRGPNGQVASVTVVINMRLPSMPPNDNKQANKTKSNNHSRTQRKPKRPTPSARAGTQSERDIARELDLD